MASYEELFEQGKDQAFLERCSVAALVLADTIVNDGAATTEEKQWAAKAFNDPLRVGRLAMYAALAANKDATLVQIQGASDSTLQTAVDAAKAVLVANGV